MSWFKATTTQTIMMCICCVFHRMIIYCNIINKGSNRAKCFFLQTRCLIFIKYNVTLSSFLFSRLSCILFVGKNKKSYLVLITVYIKIAWQQILFFLIPFVHPITSSTYLSLTNHYFCVFIKCRNLYLKRFVIKNGHF